MPWPTPVPAAASDQALTGPPDPRLPTPEAGACRSGSRLRGLPCAGQGWSEGLTQSQRHLRGHPGSVRTGESPGRVSLLCKEVSQGAARAGLRLDGGARGEAWQACPGPPPSGSPALLSPAALPQTTSLPSPQGTPGMHLPPGAMDPKLPSTSPSDTPGPMVRGMGVSRPPVRRGVEEGGGGPLPALPPSPVQGPRKTPLSSPSSARTRAPLSPLISCLRPLYPSPRVPPPPQDRAAQTGTEALGLGRKRTGSRPQRESRFSQSLGQELAGGDSPSPATSFTQPHPEQAGQPGGALCSGLVSAGHPGAGLYNQ